MAGLSFAGAILFDPTAEEKKNSRSGGLGSLGFSRQ
jgi:hypothetical protein